MNKFLARLDQYEKLTRLDKPIGILLLLWPTLCALWIAAGTIPDWRLLWIFIFGTVLMRSAGCAVNDYADRQFDRQVLRTVNRPLAAGNIEPWEALLVAAVLALIAFVMVVVMLNRETLYYSFAALFIAVSYPYTKRFLAIPQAYLGIAFSFGIPMAFAATLGFVPPLAWYLLIANLFWVIAYDTEYAMVDLDDDLKIGINTSAIFFGKFVVPAVMVCYALCLVLLIFIGQILHLRWPFYAGLIAAAGIAIYHFTLIRDRTREQCFKAFLHNNWFGAAVFLGVVSTYLPHDFLSH